MPKTPKSTSPSSGGMKSPVVDDTGKSTSKVKSKVPADGGFEAQADALAFTKPKSKDKGVESKVKEKGKALDALESNEDEREEVVATKPHKTDKPHGHKDHKGDKGKDDAASGGTKGAKGKKDDKAEALDAAIASAPPDSGFATAATDFLTGYDGLGLDKLKVDMRGRVAALGKLQGVQFESYSDIICGNDNIKMSLATIEQELAKKGRGADGDGIKQMIGDILLHASIVPARYERRPNGKTQRLAAEAVAPHVVERSILGMANKLANKDAPENADQVRGVAQSGGEDEGAAESILRVAMMNVQVDERQALLASPLFQAMRGSDDLLQTMLATSGADEQRYLNTCSISAMNQEILTLIPNIAGLLQIGRKACDSLEARVGMMPAPQKSAKWNTGPRSKKTLEARLRGEIAKARARFDAIEAQAKALVAAPGQDVGAYHALTRDWSRAMQRVGCIMVPNMSDADSLPIPTAKKIDDHWHASLLPGLRKIMTHRFKQRAEGANQAVARSYMTVAGANLPMAQDSAMQPLALKATKAERNTQMGELWQNVFHKGGANCATPGHSLYVKAVRQGDTPTFLVGDPMSSDHRPYDLDAFAKLIKDKSLEFPANFH